MRLDRGFWRSAAWTGAAALLAAVLAVQAWRGRVRQQDLGRQCAAVEREIERMRRQNEALRQELRALERDPVYVEALLRRWKMAARNERLVD